MQSLWIPQLAAIAAVLILLALFTDIAWGWIGLILAVAVIAYLLSLR